MHDEFLRRISDFKTLQNSGKGGISDMLKLDNVCYKYKNASHNVLKNINCEFKSGTLYSVVGPSGSGKTTLLSIMAGLDKPSEGSLFFDGKNLSNLDLNKYRRENISMIFQAFHLFPLLSAVENVCQPMEINGVKRQEAVKIAKVLLESVGIDEAKHKRYPSNLSGGEQQRVAIARALSSGARVIMADEPTGNLDKENGKAVMSILTRLAKIDNYCVIVVTHNMQIAEASDVVYKMDHGELRLSNHSYEMGF